MHTLQIKPLSVNQAWKGRRFKTDKYKSYEQELLLLLPHIEVNPNARLSITLELGFSNKSSDIDNPIKPFLDILQKKYGFNDCKIDKLTVIKEKVKKGDEYISFGLIHNTLV